MRIAPAEPKHSRFVLFLDVMGVRRDLVGATTRREREQGHARCQERLWWFRKDLELLRDSVPLLFPQRVPHPEFVAEFSDSVYIVSPSFATVALSGLWLMRMAVTSMRGYPLRGGIGAGTFSHEWSGVRTNSDSEVWTTSAFMGSGIVTAYEAERSKAPGLRLFVHPAVLRRNTQPYLRPLTMELPTTERSEAASHEVRLWRDKESPAALQQLRAFQATQALSERELRHYESTYSAYQRFGEQHRELPFADKLGSV